ncbi:hypothetical protein AB9E11_36050, partial [Rhizobium leguminosarum]
EIQFAAEIDTPLAAGEFQDTIPPQDFRLPNGEWLEPQTFIAEVRQAEREGLFTFNSIVDSFTHCFAVPVRGEEGHAAATL